MSGVSSASSSNIAYYASQKDLFSTLDTDQDGKLTKDEFVSGRPQNISESQATTLYSKIDAKNAGSVTEDGFKANRPSQGIESLLSSDAMAVLMLMSQQGGMSFDSGTSGSGENPSAADIYAGMDTDRNGSVTQAEFVAARPDDMSQDEASASYAGIDTEKTGAITEDQFADALKSQGEHHGGGMQANGSGGSDSSDEVYHALDVNKDGVVSQEEFLAGHPEDVTDAQATALFAGIDTEGKGAITKEQFSAFADANGDGQPLDLPADMPVDIAKGIDDLLTVLQSMTSDGAAQTDAA